MHGLYYYRARYYDPSIGRFISSDPIEFGAGDFNFYRYVGNDPVNWVDPSGLILETAWDVANVGMSAASLASNVSQGNWGWAAIDTVGLIYDAAATAIPFLPAGAGVGFKALRAGDKAVDIAKGVNKLDDGVKIVKSVSNSNKTIKVERKIPKDKLKYKPKKRGDAPIGEDGKPIELHHKDQSLGNKSPRDEMTRTDHRGKGNYKKNHPNTGQKPSTVDRTESSKQHRDHWKQEYDSGRFDNLPEQPK